MPLWTQRLPSSWKVWWSNWIFTWLGERRLTKLLKSLFERLICLFNAKWYAWTKGIIWQICNFSSCHLFCPWNTQMFEAHLQSSQVNEERPTSVIQKEFLLSSRVSDFSVFFLIQPASFDYEWSLQNFNVSPDSEENSVISDTPCAFVGVCPMWLYKGWSLEKHPPGLVELSSCDNTHQWTQALYVTWQVCFECVCVRTCAIPEYLLSCCSWQMS